MVLPRVAVRIRRLNRITPILRAIHCANHFCSHPLADLPQHRITAFMESANANLPPPNAQDCAQREVMRLRDLSPQQWKSGIAAWLGWTFDGLELHIYTLVATPFVAELLRIKDTIDPRVGRYGS